MPRGTDRSDEALIQGRLWTPAQLRAQAKLFSWHDGADQSFIDIGTGSGVATWRDKAGFARTCSQATAASQPTLLQGKGVTNTGTVRVFIVDNQPSGDCEYFAVLKTNSSNATWRTLCYSSANNHSCLFESGSDRLGCFNGAFGASGYTVAVNTYVIVVLKHLAVTGAVSIAIDDQPYAAIANIAGHATRLLNETAGSQPTGELYEWVRSNGLLTTDERTKLIASLAHKWDRIIGGKAYSSRLLASNLYKNRPPLIGD